MQNGTEDCFGWSEDWFGWSEDCFGFNEAIEFRRFPRDDRERFRAARSRERDLLRRFRVTRRFFVRYLRRAPR